MVKKIKMKSSGIYRVENGNTIYGKSLPIFVHNVSYHLTQLNVYSDGMVECWGLMDLKTFKEKLAKGWFTIKVPEGERVSIHPLGSFKAMEIRSYVEPDELIKEIEDIILQLNSKPTSEDKCVLAYKKYLKNSNITNKTKLKDAYKNVPKHNRIYILGDMDKKDQPIRKIIYEETG